MYFCSLTLKIFCIFFTGEKGSYVFGAISDGVFEGKLVTPRGKYYVEKAYKYFPDKTNQSFHSVIYAENDVEDPYEDVRTGRF